MAEPNALEARTSVRIPSELDRRFKRQLKLGGYSYSGIVRVLIEDWVDARESINTTTKEATK